MAAGESYLLLGPELGEKDDMMAEIKQRYLSRVYGEAAVPESAVEKTSFYAGEDAGSEIAAFLCTGSLFSDVRVVYIKNIDTLSKNDAENIAAYIEAPAENTLLFLTGDETKAEKTLEAAAGKNKRVFWELQDNQKPQWLRSYWQRRGFALAADAAELLLEMIENNTAALRKESERLMEFFRNNGAAAGGGKTQRGGAGVSVDAASLEEYLSHSRNETPFTLFSAIAAGDLSKSLEILHTLLSAQESPIGIFAGLTWSYSKLRDYGKLCEKGMAGNDFELKKIGITTIKAKKEFPLAYKVHGPAAAERFLALTAEYDMLIRSEGGPLKEILMDIYLYRLMPAPARSGAR